MSNENKGLLPHRIDTQIHVRRNFKGVIDEGQSFDRREDAAAYIADGRRFRHDVTYTFTEGQQIDTRLAGLGEGFPQEMLLVNFLGREGLSPRTVEGHHGVSTDYASFFYLIFNIDQYNDPFLDRGLAWLHVNSPLTPLDVPSLLFNCKENNLSVDDIMGEFRRTDLRSIEILNDLATSYGR